MDLEKTFIKIKIVSLIENMDDIEILQIILGLLEE